jgi:hypothetical protein
MKQQNETQHIEQVRAYLSQRRQQVYECWQDLSELISRLESDRIIETDTADRFKMEKQIERLTGDKARLERQLQDLEQDLADLDDPELTADCRDKYPLPLPSTEKELKSLAAIQRHIQAGKDYFEHITGNVFTGPVTIYQQESAEDPTPLREAYLTWLIRKAGYVPLTEIDPKIAAAEADSQLTLDAIYTALLTLTPEEHDRFRKGEAMPDRRKSALAQVDEYQHLVLLGGPGSGKTTFVNFVTICLAGEWLGRQDINLNLLRSPLPDDKEQRPQPWSHGKLLPVRIRLQEFAAEGLPGVGEAVTGDCLWSFIEKQLEQEGIREFIPHLRRHLREQGGLFLLDGLDEVPETGRLRVHLKQVIEGCTSLFPRCRILVTSRTYAYQNPEWKLMGFAETVLSTFTEAQIRSFVSRWYAFITRFRDMTEQDALAQAEELNGRIFQNPRLEELAERPILLTLMTSLHASRGRLPEKRVELYQDTFCLFFEILSFIMLAK